MREMNRDIIHPPLHPHHTHILIDDLLIDCKRERKNEVIRPSHPHNLFARFCFCLIFFVWLVCPSPAASPTRTPSPRPSPAPSPVGGGDDGDGGEGEGRWEEMMRGEKRRGWEEGMRRCEKVYIVRVLPSGTWFGSKKSRLFSLNNSENKRIIRI